MTPSSQVYVSITIEMVPCGSEPDSTRLDRSAARTCDNAPSRSLGLGECPLRRCAPSAAVAYVGVDLQERAHRRFGPGARHAAFGGDAERRRVAARRRDAGPGARDPVACMHHAEIKLGARAELEIAQRLM